MEQAERISKELINEDVSLWFCLLPSGSKIMVKTTTNAIKAVFKGCRIEFLFGKDNHSVKSYFHSGITIFDNKTNGLNVIAPNIFTEEHVALQEILRQEKTNIEFYNELGICVLHGFVCFEPVDRRKVLDFVGEVQNLFSGRFDSNVNSSLDSFEYSLDPAQSIPNANIIDTIKIGCVISELIPMSNI